MLRKVLKKEDCASCTFCCSFRRQSLWELPRLPVSFGDRHKSGFEGRSVEYDKCSSAEGEWITTHLDDGYKTDDPEEEAACPFLDPKGGCILPPEEKPFECSMWPLRYMRMPDGRLEVCLTPTCPVINKADTEVLRQYSQKEWAPAIREYAREHPYIIKDYREGFIVL